MTSSGLATGVAILAFLVTAGGVIGVSLRIGRNTQTIANYREAATSWEAKAKAQEGQIEELQAADTAKATQITELTAKVQLLQDMVTGKTAIEQLAAQVADTFARIDEKLIGRDVFEKEFADLRAELRSGGGR
jgi:hypothetical protein